MELKLTEYIYMFALYGYKHVSLVFETYITYNLECLLSVYFKKRKKTLTLETDSGFSILFINNSNNKKKKILTQVLLTSFSFQWII